MKKSIIISGIISLIMGYIPAVIMGYIPLGMCRSVECIPAVIMGYIPLGMCRLVEKQLSHVSLHSVGMQPIINRPNK